MNIKKDLRSIMLFALICGSMSVPVNKAEAADRLVPSQYGTISAAVGAAVSGSDSIVFEGAVFNHAGAVSIGKNLIFTSADTSSPSTINIGGANRLTFTVNSTGSSISDLILTGGANSVIGINAGVDITVKNTTFTANSATGNGGAILNSGNLTIDSGNSFIDNIDATHGGAIYSTGTLTINSGNSFSGNAARSNGGAIYSNAGNLTINAGNSFDGNTAGGSGGAIYNNTGTLTMDSGGTFINNTAVISGGAIYNNTGTLTLSGKFIFDNNTAERSGGAIFNAGAATLNFDAGTQFTNNKTVVTAGTAYGSGGAINNSATGAIINLIGTGADKILMTNNIATGISGSSGGGAIYNRGASAVNIDHVIFDGNRSAGSGGTIHNREGGVITIQNSTFTNTSAGGAGGVFYNDGAGSTITILDAVTFDGITAGTNGGVLYNGAEATASFADGAVFTNNSAGSNGGAIYNIGTVTIGSNSSFVNSTATGSSGGAIYNTGILNLSGKYIFDNNTANINGGAIYNTNAGSTLMFGAGTQFTNNKTLVASGNYNGSGGAIHNYAAGAIIEFVGIESDKILIKNNRATSTSVGAGGGAIYNRGTSTISIDHVIFDGNSSAGLGGTIHNREGGVITIQNSTFTNTSAGGAGGVFYNDGAGSTITILDAVTFDGITAGTNGGVLYNGAEATASFADGAVFTNNSAGSNGGAIYNAGTIAIGSNSSFTNNTAGSGGAIYNAGNLTLSGQHTFNNNSVNTNGGAIYNDTGALTINLGSLFTNNAAGNQGGAISSIGDLVINSNVTFDNNTGKLGGAIYTSGAASLTINPGVTFHNNQIEGTINSRMGGGAISHFDAAGALTIDSTIFTKNKATPVISLSHGLGGAVYNSGTNVANIITGSTFTSNIARVGGAIYNTGTLEIGTSSFTDNSVITDQDLNTNNVSGGAIFNSGELILSAGNTFTGNFGKSGGAVKSTGTLLSINDNIFTSNYTENANNSGGAVHSAATNTVVTNSTFRDNNATGSAGALYISGDATVSNTLFEGNTAIGAGGAAQLTGASENTIYLNAGNQFIGNTSSGSGGAISHGSCDLIIDNNTFTNNTALNGGAIYRTGGGGAIGASSLIIGNSTFTDNTATGNTGGAIYIHQRTLSLLPGNTFIGNRVLSGSGYGGGAVNNASGIITIDNNIFKENYSAGNGGAIHSQNGTNTIERSMFEANIADRTGGAINNHIATGSMLLKTGNLFERNIARMGGGAISNTGSLTIETGNFFIANVSDVLNEGTTSTTSVGGAIYNNSGVITIDTGTFAGNTAKAAGGVDSGDNINSSTVARGGAIANIVASELTISGSSFMTNTVFVENINYYLGVLDTDYTLDNGPIVLNIASGGTIYNNGTMTINNSNITGSSVDANNISILSEGVSTVTYGGAIFNSGNLTINGNSSITGSSITTTNVQDNVAEGGAIYNVGTLNLDSTVGNIIFGGTLAADKNTVNGVLNDIYNAKDSVIDISGSANDVVVYSGIKSGIYNEDPDLDTLGSATINKSGNGRLVINADSSMYTGLFESTGGTTIVSAAGKMFGGDYTKNNITNSILEVTSDSGVYYELSLNTGGQLKHFSNTTSQSIIDNTKIVFTDTGATATFDRDSSLGIALAKYTLNGPIENAQANDVVFNNSDVSLGTTDYTGETTYTINNGQLNLNSLTLQTYEFDNLRFNNSKLGFGVGMQYEVDGTPKEELLSDKLQVNNTTTDTVGLGVIKVYDASDRGLGEEYYATILTGAGGLKFVAGDTTTLATTAYEYTVEVDADQTGIVLNAYKASDEYSLNAMNILEGTRGFNFTYFDGANQTYNIGASLDDMASGIFEVSGIDNSTSILSGALVDSTGTPTGQNGSFFKIVNDNTNFYMHDLTIQEAYSTTNGSVLNMSNAGSIALLENLNIANNSSVNNGGAIYNEAGVIYIIESTLQDNTARNGGSIYNTGEDSTINIANSTFIDNTASGTGTTNGGGVIYNTAAATVNIFGSDFEDNTAARGGAIFNSSGGIVNITSGTTFTSNYASINGGAIYNSSSGIMTIENTSFTDNTSASHGGAIFNTDGTINLGYTTFTSNATTYNGGAIYNSYDGIVNIAGNTIFSNNITGSYGGAIYNERGGNIDIGLNAGNVTFEGNTAARGGAIYNTTAATVNIAGNNFEDNTAVLGGAIYNSSAGEVTITNSVFTDNTASGTALTHGGGAIYNTGLGSTVTINSTTFTENTAGSFGGAIANYEGGAINLTNTIFNGNTATTSGGAIYNTGTDSSVTINGANFEDNAANQGGAIFNDTDASLTINNVRFGENTAIYGGAIRNLGSTEISNSVFNKNKVSGTNSNGGAINSGGTLVLDGNIFSENTAENFGGAIHNAGSNSVATIRNNVFTKNEATKFGGAINNEGIVTISDSLFDNNSAADGGGAIYNKAYNSLGFSYSPELNINGNTSFTNNTATTGNGGAIYNEYILRLNTTGGNISFTGNTANGTANDIHNVGTIDIIGTGKGTVYLEGGISGTALAPDGVTPVAINQNSTGNVIFGENSVNDNYLGIYNQTAGTTTFLGDSFFGGTNNITNSNLSLFTKSLVMDINHLALNSANVNSINNVLNTFNITDFNPTGTNNFHIDINGLTGISDQYNFISTTGTGIINVDRFNVTSAPTAETIDFTVFTGDISGLTFTSSEKKVITPIYKYLVQSLDPDNKGAYRLYRSSINPQAFRGQVATMAAFNNQLTVNNTLFDRVYLNSETYAHKNDNKYAAALPQFAPYQYKSEGGSLWFKNYVTFERLSMTQGLNVGNNAYGSLVGADFDAVNLKNGWKLLPTAYIGYNGAHQTFSGVSMYQNGGQGGVMGTFMKGDFIGSLLAYAGGYHNEMSLQGTTDRTGNWFAGTAVKTAYNFHPTRNLILQPTLLASYNAFGKQNFYSNFGQVGMNNGMLNGINVAPGFNVIYGRETWSVYATAQYMYYINEQISGRVAGTSLPSLKMNHGFIEYGVGGTKTLKERLMGYFQVTLRNGGRTGVGFQFGLTWKL